MAPPVIGSSKTEKTKANSSPFSQHGTSSWLARKSISEREVKGTKKADDTTLPKENQKYQKLGKNKKDRLSESHPLETQKMPNRK